MNNKKLFLFLIGFFIILFSFSFISSFCTVQGYIYDAGTTRTIADDVNVTCSKASNETVDVIPGVDTPDDGYGVNFGGLLDTCTYCTNGIYVWGVNSSLGIAGENSSTSCTGSSCTLDIHMTGAAVADVAIVTPTADYNYTQGTTDYNATCTSGVSISEVVFMSNHTGSNLNYTWTSGNVSNVSSTFTYLMPSLPAGVGFTYSWYCNDTTPNSDTDGPQIINILQTTGVIDLYLNNSQDNISLTNGTSIDLNATLTTGEGDIQLYKDGILINSGSSPLWNYTLFDDGIALVNITAIFSGNTNYTRDTETWWVNVSTDINPPYFTDIPLGGSHTINYGDSINLDFDADDAEGNFDSYAVNDSRFTINSAGTMTNVQALSAGTYKINVTINDTFANLNSTVYTVNVNQDAGACSVLFNETSPLNYTQSFIVYTDCTTGFSLYRNGTSISNNSVQSLGAGSYNFTVIRTDQQNYSNAADEEFFTINKAQGEVAVYLNATRNNYTIINDSSIDLNASLLTGTGNIYLYNNEVLINSGSSPLWNYTYFGPVGLRNITAISDGDENYTSASETWWLNVSSGADINPPIFTDIANISIYDNESVYYDVNATDASGIDCFTVNNTNNFSIDCSGILQNITGLDAGIYWLNISVNDTLNNINTQVIYVNVSEVPPEAEANVTLYGVYEPLCCSGGTGDYCLTSLEYNETTQEGDIYCEGDTAGNNIVVNVQHVMDFEFSGVTIDSNDVLECVLEDSEGTLIIVNKTGLTLNNEDYTMKYAVSNDSVITRDEGSGSIHDLPWGLHNCSVKNELDVVINSTDYNQVVFMHRNLQWNTFDYQKAVFAESVPYKFFNNTFALEKYFIDTGNKSYSRNLAFKHYAGSQTEEFCTDGSDNDADSSVDSDDDDCRTFTHRYNVSHMNFTIPNFLNILTFLQGQGITGRVISADDDNIVTDSLGSVSYWYTLNTDLDGSFKARIYETSPGSSGYGYTIKNFPNVSSIGLIGTVPSGYSSSYACGAAAGLDEGYCNINLDCAACADGLVDFVYLINSSSNDLDASVALSIETVHGTTVEEESFTAYFDPNDGLNNTFENESTSATDNNLCDDSMNNDLDISSLYTYINGLSSTNKITWSRDCADPDCSGINGPIYTAEQDYTFAQGTCEYLTETICNDGFDNDFNDNYTTDAYGMQGYYYTDCHDADCFSNGVECASSETVCNDSLNNDWDYVDTNSESTSGHKIGNTDNSGGTTWNNLKYDHSTLQANLIDCEDPDCNGLTGGSSGELCEWSHEANCSDGFNNDALQTYDCQTSGTYGTVNDQAPAYSHAEYDCSVYCRANVDSDELGTQCDDGIDNDWDYWDNSSIFSGSTGAGGIDCGWNGSGLDYNPDLDCDNETMGNGKVCEIGTELTCDDSFDNDYDNKASDSSTRGAEWNSTLYEAYFGAGTYVANGDCDDYDCSGNIACPTEENLNAAWCFDDADNDLDGDVDCSDSDCAGVANPANPAERCLEYELNVSALSDANENTTSVHFCGNNVDDENKDDDNNLSSVFGYNSLGFTYTGDRTEKMDCNDADCRQQFGQCAPCANNEFVEWDSCFDGYDNDHDTDEDMADSDCAGMINDTRGYNTTNGPSTETDCMNLYDDDGDGAIDCLDSDCLGQVFSADGRTCAYDGTEDGAGDCSDGFDNDNDGYLDCRDSSCSDECGIDPISGAGLTHDPENSSFSLTGDVTISGTASTIVRKGEDLYVTYSYSSGTSNGVTIYLGSYATGEVINTTVFDVPNADFVSNPDGFGIDKTYDDDGYLIFTKPSIDSFSFTVKIPGKDVVSESSTIKSTAEIGTNTASGTFNTEVVNNETPSISVLKLEPSTGQLSVGDQIQVIAGNFTGVSGGQSNSGQAGRCRIQISGPNGFSVDVYRRDCDSIDSSVYEVSSSGTYYVNVTPYDNTGNEGTALSDSLTLSVAPKITLGLNRADGKRVFMDTSDTRFDSFGDEYNANTGTMIASFETDANNPYTSTSCTASIWNESGSLISTEQVTSTLLSSGAEVNCIVDSDLTGVSSDGLYRVTVNATDSQGYAVKTAELVFFNCQDLTSSGSTWNCALADFDVDGYTEGINLSFNYSDGNGSLEQLACDSCPGETNLGKDGDADGYDNACDPICGDGYAEGGEQCDDGNIVSGDGCSSSCTTEAPADGGDGGAGGGGGGGGAAGGGGGGGAAAGWFSIEPDPLEVKIHQGSTKTIKIEIENTIDMELNMTINYSALDRFIYMDEKDLEFSIDPNESEFIDIEVFAREDEIPDVYAGQIVFVGNWQEYKLDVLIEVKEKRSLFDIETTVKDKTVGPGSVVEAEINVTDLGDLGEIEAVLHYELRDFENKTWASNSENVTIIGSETFERSLTIPEDAPIGDYFFYSRLEYEGLIATSADSFEVVTIAGTVVLLAVTMTLIITTVIVIIILYRRNVFLMGTGGKTPVSSHEN